MATTITVMDLMLMLDVLAETLHGDNPSVYKTSEDARMQLANKIQTELSGMKLSISSK